MGIFIKGMEMPKCCSECDFHQSGFPDWCDLRVTARDIHNPTVLQDWCPLVPVPPHGRLIDADKLLEKLRNTKFTTISAAVAYLESAPTIILADSAKEDE